MKIEIPIKYNLKNIEIFLNIFNMQLVQPSDLNKFIKNQKLLIVQNNLVVGEVSLNDENIKISFKTELGNLEATTNYANSTLVTDYETYDATDTIGMFASWYNEFIFKLKMPDNKELDGSIILSEKIDNEFGNRVTSHIDLKYQDSNKKYKIEFQNSGKPFYFKETKKDFTEEISYQIFNNWGSGSFFHHIIKTNKISPTGENIHIYDASFISEAKDKNIAIKHYEENKQCLKHVNEYFKKLSTNEEKIEIINKINHLHNIDARLALRINELIEEFKLSDISIMEKFFLYGFSNYDKEEIEALFKIPKKDIDLCEMYFKNEEEVAKIFTMGSKKNI